MTVGIIILGAVLMIFWTQEILLGKPIQFFKEEKKKSEEEKLADALKDYLNKGIKIQAADDKNGKKGG